jgi:hypothetical protein
MMWIDGFLRWYMTGFLIVFGVWVMHGMERVALVCRAVPDVADAELARRIDAVVAARADADAFPRYLPFVAGGMWIVLAALVGAGLLAPALGYAVGCVAFATFLAYAYLRSRNARGSRVALLVPRTLGMPLPRGWYALAALSACAVLVFSPEPRLRIAAVLVCASALITVALTVLTTAAPALLFGQDLSVERFVDDRVRFARTAGLLNLAFVQPFVFCAFAWAISSVAYGALAVEATFAALFAFAVWMVLKRRTRSAQTIAEPA